VKSWFPYSWTSDILGMALISIILSLWPHLHWCTLYTYPKPIFGISQLSLAGRKISHQIGSEARYQFHPYWPEIDIRYSWNLCWKRLLRKKPGNASFKARGIGLLLVDMPLECYSSESCASPASKLCEEQWPRQAESRSSLLVRLLICVKHLEEETHNINDVHEHGYYRFLSWSFWSMVRNPRPISFEKRSINRQTPNLLKYSTSIVFRNPFSTSSLQWSRWVRPHSECQLLQHKPVALVFLSSLIADDPVWGTHFRIMWEGRENLFTFDFLIS